MVAATEAKAEQKATTTIVVGSREKEIFQKFGLRVSSDVVDAVSADVEARLIAAAARTKANGRVTVRGFDI